MKRSRSHTWSKPRPPVLWIMLVLCISTNMSVQAQDVSSQNFQKALNATLDLRSTDYSIIDSRLLVFKNDSISMRQLASASRESKYLDGECYALNALGIIYRNISAYPKAIALHREAEKLAVIAGNLELQIFSLNMHGVVYRRMDFIRSALDYHSKALNMANTVEEPTKSMMWNIAVSHNGIGNIYLALKQYDLALEQFNKSLSIEQRLDNRLGLAINHQNIGYIKEHQGDLEEALKDYQKSLAYNNEIDSDVGRVICYNSMVRVYIKQKRLDEALKLSQTTLPKALTVGDPFYISTSYTNLGWAHCALNQILDAKENLDLALEVSRSYGLKSSEIDVHKRLGEYYTKTENYKMALEEFKLADALEKSINNERNLNYINDLALKYDSEGKSNTIRGLTDENLLVKTQLEKNQLILLFGLLALILMVVILMIYDRHKQLKLDKKILTLEQDMLRSQMNPHFIFNSLNSIKHYIINSEKENAVYYLNTFSKLIRKILIASKEKDISLADELDTMELYMNVENNRFSNQIEFKISIEDGINIKNIKVPSLILQPFLENALWHGLSSKEKDKRISLDVKQKDKMHVVISITDNGVGRKFAEEINKRKTLKRKSLGIALTKARLENFSKRYTKMYNLNIEDLYEDNGKACGTKVILDIPVTLSSKQRG